MNERFNQLLKQVEEETNAEYQDESRRKRRLYNEILLPKFAELIVRECAVYCEGHILPKGMAEEHGVNYNDGVMDCAIGLKQHFGVEE